MKKGVKKESNFSKRLSYTIIAVLSILLVGVGVYAYGTSAPSTFGHTMSELTPPAYCGGYNDGYLVYQAGWKCLNKPVTTSAELGIVRVSKTGTGTSVMASCPSGKTLISGGCISSYALTGTYPLFGNDAWSCSVSSNPTSSTLTAYVICAD